MKKTLRQKRVGETLVRLQDASFVTHESGAGLTSFHIETRPVLPLGDVVGAFFWDVVDKKRDKESAMQAFDEVCENLTNK